eukprot:scaffold271572_cov32-Tisochrysis_lutea.AAC.3
MDGTVDAGVSSSEEPSVVKAPISSSTKSPSITASLSWPPATSPQAPGLTIEASVRAKSLASRAALA